MKGIFEVMFEAKIMFIFLAGNAERDEQYNRVIA